MVTRVRFSLGWLRPFVYHRLGRSQPIFFRCALPAHASCYAEAKYPSYPFCIAKFRNISILLFLPILKENGAIGKFFAIVLHNATSFYTMGCDRTPPLGAGPVATKIPARCLTALAVYGLIQLSSLSLGRQRLLG